VITSPLKNVQTPQRYSLVPYPSPLAAPLVDLLGRRKGIIPFLLGLFGLKSTARLIVTAEEVNCETKTFAGTSVELIPISRVADVHVAQYRSIGKLIAGPVFLFYGTIGFFTATEVIYEVIGVLVTLIGIAVLVDYFLKPRLMIAIFSESGIPIAVVLQGGKIKDRTFGLSDLVNIQRTIRMLAAGNHAAASQHVVDEFHPSGPDPEEEEEDEVEIEEPDVNWQAPAVVAPPRPSPMEAEQTARRLLDEARRRAKDGDRDGAIKLLRELVDAYPETTPAEQAKKNLAKIGIRV
jgi:hypothetical protein